MAIRITRVDHAARRQRIELQRRWASRRASRNEVAIDVEHDVGRVGHIDTDPSIGSTGRNDRGIRFDPAIERVHQGHRGLSFARLAR